MKELLHEFNLLVCKIKEMQQNVTQEMENLVLLCDKLENEKQKILQEQCKEIGEEIFYNLSLMHRYEKEFKEHLLRKSLEEGRSQT